MIISAIELDNALRQRKQQMRVSNLLPDQKLLKVYLLEMLKRGKH